ncbi:AAA family ATPase [Pyxidicoccus xibeiensis]|uniref:AAA family ATPase n=1 Tax=Pyxidicoccus xibeiensis TaxID=2906759 RepID=UPI0020A730AD|nr:AAA family ATPase [Pyxidicoccus xibeiensis]MCP3142104.1 AAA family ATPase [Pyxidicoccus xibeiensis]
MRLRYLHLAHYPPLADLAVDFSLRAPWGAFEPRGGAANCSIHFVIGLNGSGKSHLLRAVSSTFLALADERLPPFPVSLVYELGRPGESGHRTLIFDCPGEQHATSLWLAEGWAFDDTTERETFQNAIDYLRQVDSSLEGPLSVFRARIARGDYPQAAPDALPRAVLAYTSGLIDAWREAWQPPVEGEALDLVTHAEDYDPKIERPPGWTAEDEARTMLEGDSFDEPVAAPSAVGEASPKDLFLRPLLLESMELASALLAVALQGAERRRLGQEDQGLADLFVKAGWHRLVGVRLRLNLARALTAQRALLTRLHDALLAAGEVIAEPHPTEKWRSLYFDIEGPLPQDRGKFADQARFEKLGTQGEALHALLGELGDTAFERFGALLAWRRHGLLEGLELFIRRTDRPEEERLDSLDDVGVLRYSELSDGERMVLGRWALFHLLARQDDALLLLDEPETHFNDAWKREIVGVVDDAMGADASQVLIATHSAIVLSDVFDDEVVLIRKTDGRSTAAQVSDRTFATDPSALMMTVFGADDSIGVRAQRRIEAFIQAASVKTHPSQEDVRQLHALIRRMGTGFYRTELQTLLNRWQQAPDLRAIEQVIPVLQSDPLRDELRALLLKARQATPGTAEEGDA